MKHPSQTDQTRLEAELDFIVGQQKELEALLLPLEEGVGGEGAQGGDRQRDNMYHLAQVQHCNIISLFLVCHSIEGRNQSFEVIVQFRLNHRTKLWLSKREMHQTYTNGRH